MSPAREAQQTTATHDGKPYGQWRTVAKYSQAEPVTSQVEVVMSTIPRAPFATRINHAVASWPFNRVRREFIRGIRGPRHAKKLGQKWRVLITKEKLTAHATGHGTKKSALACERNLPLTTACGIWNTREKLLSSAAGNAKRC